VLSECCKCHFRDPNFKNFLGGHAPRHPYKSRAFGTRPPKISQSFRHCMNKLSLVGMQLPRKYKDNFDVLSELWPFVWSYTSGKEINNQPFKWQCAQMCPTLLLIFNSVQHQSPGVETFFSFWEPGLKARNFCKICNVTITKITKQMHNYCIICTLVIIGFRQVFVCLYIAIIVCYIPQL
jgi:hypothetical protein